MEKFVHVAQEIASRQTSVNVCASTFNRIDFDPGSLNLDYGGGKFETGTQTLAAKGVENLVYDPFNRGAGHNLTVRLKVARAGGADSATVNNVLNVIAEEDALRDVVAQAANGLKAGGLAYFLIHEGDGSGVGKATSKGWQRNERAEAYREAISASFAQIHRKGRVFVASEPIQTARSLFSLLGVEHDILAEAKKAGVPMPSAKYGGVGKMIGGCLYLHRSAWDAFPAERLEKALARLPTGFNPVVAKWDERAGSMSFMESSGFDAEPEPAIQRSVKVLADGSVGSVRAERFDPQIYHHKWSFVRPSHQGFDYFESALRSISWAGSACDRAVIGSRSRWEADVVWPELGGVGAFGPDPRASPSSSKIGPK